MFYVDPFASMLFYLNLQPLVDRYRDPQLTHVCLILNQALHILILKYTFYS